MQAFEMSNYELIEHAKTLVKSERELIADMILALREVFRRKLFFALGYGSLFDFCTKGLGLSDDQSWKRTQVAKAACFHPQVIDMLRSGEAKLAHMALAAPKLTKANARVVFEAMKGVSKRQFEAKLRCIRDDGFVREDPAQKTRIVIEVSAEELEALERIRGLLACKGKLRNGGAGGVVAAMTEYCLDKLDPERKARRALRVQSAKSAVAVEPVPAPGQEWPSLGFAPKQAHTHPAPSDQARTPPAPWQRLSERSAEVLRARYIPAAVRHAVVFRDGERCTFVGEGGRRCDATVGLENDHRVMVCEGGEHTVENLRRMCRGHNRLLSERRLGREFVERAAARG